MALTYAQTTNWTSTGTAGTGGYYKDIVFSGAAAGDLIMVFGAAENYNQSGGTRSVTTQAGSTSSWTLVSPAGTLNNDTDAIGGWATVSSTGSVTVRVQVRDGATDHMGACGVLIPAAEYTGTPGSTSFAADTDGQTSVTLPATCTVLYGGADWSATGPGTTNTPAGSTNRASITDSPQYSVAVRTWTGQGSGTRAYGPSGLSGVDYTGVVLYVQEASGSNIGTLSASVPVLTGSITGTATNAGTLAGSTPTLTGTASGASINSGTTAGSTPVLTGSTTGQSVNSGTLAGSTPTLTGTLTGAATNPGTLSGAVPLLTGALADTATNPATLAGSVPLLAGSITGQSVNPGTLAGNLPIVTGSITGTAKNSGTLSGKVPLLTGQISDQVTNPGTLSGSLPKITGTITGTSTNPATLTGQVPRVTGAITGTVINPAALAGTLPAITGLLAGASTNPATLAGVLPLLTGHMDDRPAVPPDPSRTRLVPASLRTQVVPASDRTRTVPPSDRTITVGGHPVTLDRIIDPDEVRDYTWDWTARLDDGETITSHTVTATGCTLDTQTATTTTVTAWVSHATKPRASILCHVVTSNGRQYDDTIQLTVRDL